MDNLIQYVYNNYKQYKDKALIIEEYEKFYTIKVNKDESPLILSKTVV